MGNPQNVLQFEFFHVGGSGVVSLEAIFAECEERTLDALELFMGGHEFVSGIKTVIRIYDIEGTATALAHKIEKLETHINKLSVMSRTSFFHSILIEWWTGITFHRSKVLREKLFLYAVNYLDRAFNELPGVAIERVDGSFRKAKRDELFELAQAVKMAKAFWLFIFEPNNLLADENENIVSVM